MSVTCSSIRSTTDQPVVMDANPAYSLKVSPALPGRAAHPKVMDANPAYGLKVLPVPSGRAAHPKVLDNRLSNSHAIGSGPMPG